MIHTSRTLAALAVSLSLMVAGCTPGANPAAGGSGGFTVKFGFIAPLSGTDAAFGEGTVNGARLAIEHVNAAGGVDGQKLELLLRDDAGNADKGVTAAQDLVKQNVVAVIGPIWSGVTKAVVEKVTREAGVPTISPGATSPALATFEDGGCFFRTIPNDLLQGKAISKLLRDEAQQGVTIVYRDNAYGKGLADAIDADLTATGAKALAKVAYGDSDQVDYAALKAKIPAGTTAIAMVAYTGDATSVLRDWIASNENPTWKWYFSESLRDNTLADNVANPAKLEGFKGTFPQPAGNGYAAFATAFKTRFGKEPGVYDANAYDAVMLAALAMVQGGIGTNRDNLNLNPTDTLNRMNEVVDANNTAIKAANNTRQAIMRTLADVSRTGTKQTGFGVAGFTDAVAKLKAGIDLDYDGVSSSVDMDDRGEMTGGGYVIWQWQGGKYVNTSTLYQF
jgi:branched-chain amino acid transport system substrate-binding protein